jgi:four helix bundle protein
MIAGRVAVQREAKGFRNLEVWQKGIDLVVMIYHTTGRFPTSEQYCLTSQMRRAAVSIPANIAEGRGRKHQKEYLNFLSMAYGSLMELETHLHIAKRLGYLKEDEEGQLIASTTALGKMLNSLINSMTPN